MWTYPKVVAHRGGGRLAPENTLAALRCGLAQGFHAVEFDVMAVRDGGLVLMHDPELGRTVAGHGKVADFSAAELMQMDAGAWFGSAFAGETVPGFATVADFCLQHSIWMNVEIKPADDAEAMAAETGRLVGAACAALPAGAALLSSFSFAALAAARQAAPSVPRALLVERVPADWQAQLQALDAVALHVKASLLSADDAAAIKQAGYGLFCYTVNDPEQARALLGIGVDAFCTDCIDVIGPDFCDVDLTS